MRMRAKILLGFLVLGLLLLFSGMVSYFELNRMGKNTREVLEESSHNVELSEKMMDALNEQNITLMQAITLDSPRYDTIFYSLRAKFDSALEEITQNEDNLMEVVSIHSARDSYYELIEEYFRTPERYSIEEFAEAYSKEFFKLSYEVKHYLDDSQHSLKNGIIELEETAYRATTAGIVTLSVTIFIVIVFAFFIDIYYIKPILEINSGLDGFITKGSSFVVKVEGDKDMESLRERIDTLIKMYVKK